MFWANTIIFRAISNFLQSVWAEPTGKIFLVTVVAYSFSYILYSGYLAWFSGGIGSIPLSQVGFSAIDFFGLIPTVYLLIFQLVWKLLKFAFRIFLVYGFAPLITLLIAGLITVNYEITIFVRSSSLASFVSFLGSLIWMAGFLWGFSSYVNDKRIPKWSWILSCSGSFLVGLSSPYISSAATSATNSGVIETNLFLELGAIFVLLFIFSFPYFMGIYLAQLSVNEKALSKIQRIIFNSPLDISGMVREAPINSRRVKSLDQQIYKYCTSREQPVYLVSTFSKHTALFLPPITSGEDQGKLVIISNDEIRLLELNSRTVAKDN